MSRTNDPDQPPKCLTFGDSITQRVNGIDFSRASYYREGHVNNEYRIGNTKVPARLYALVLSQAEALATKQEETK